MKTKMKTTNIDEVTFEKRNKEYGAYYIRKSYNRYLSRAIVIGIIAVVSATIIPFLIFKEARSVNIDGINGVVFVDLTDPNQDITPPPPPPPPPPPDFVEKQAKFTTIVLTTDSVEDTGILNQDILNQQSTISAPIEINEIKVEKEVVKVIEQVAPPPTYVSLMPTYVGGEAALYVFLAENIKYPTIARENNITGTVFITFVVEIDGSITNAQILKDIGGSCGDEAMRVVKAMPKWNVGKQNGIPTRVAFTLPIKFTLSN